MPKTTTVGGQKVTTYYDEAEKEEEGLKHHASRREQNKNIRESSKAKASTQYAPGTVGPLEPAGHKIARVLMPKTTASVREVGYVQTAKNAAVRGGRQVTVGAATVFASTKSGAPAFLAAPPPALTMRPANLPGWVLGGGYPWQRQPRPPREQHTQRKRTKKKEQRDNVPDWIRY